jgi:lipid II:glycine glycyltransferase (peptidoglycan interpeptide bridge formation enzyme)
MVSVLLARERGHAIAGIVQLRFRDRVYYKFAASERESLAKNPNHLLIWRMIQDAARGGYRFLDFGRTYVGDAGLMQWKSRWGARREDFAYVYPMRPGAGRLSREGTRANAVLGGILRRMPCFMVRASGELLYRYLA